MRSSLSCDACRRSKVKCFHAGSPPCQRCQKSALTGCVLTRPKTGAGHTAGLKRKAVISQQPQSNGQPIPAQSPVLSPPPPPPSSSSSTLDRAAVDAHLASLSDGTILKASGVFVNSFPELSMLHLPTFLHDLVAGPTAESRTLLAAILAVTRLQPPVLTASWARFLLSRELYASYAEEMLPQLIFQPPRIQVVQALLVMTLHEWGCRDFHKAWIYCGIAIRIMQAIHSMRVAPNRLDTSSDTQLSAVETRTYWACFIMDCMINSGTYNPPMLPMSEMRKLKIARPLSVVDFAFGPDVPSHAINVAHSGASQVADALDVTQSFEILIGGLEIWNQVMTFIFNDGRRAPGMCAPHNCPWVRSSPWSSSMRQLEAWRAQQHRKLHYPSTSVAAHMTLGYGETFVYLNLLYYTSALMLHREYFPFLPDPDAEPQGPIDRPRLEASAPPGWWKESAAQLFGAAEHIASILRQASDCGVYLMTPFAGFCAFSAAFINLYAFRYPRMNFNRSPNAEACLTICLDYLEEVRHVWRIADGWIKTIHQLSLLYERAVRDRARYTGRTRYDFDTLHRSMHEFRVVDRSHEHQRELDGAENAAASSEGSSGEATVMTDLPECADDTNSLLSQLLAEVGTNFDEQGALVPMVAIGGTHGSSSQWLMTWDSLCRAEFTSLCLDSLQPSAWKS